MKPVPVFAASALLILVLSLSNCASGVESTSPQLDNTVQALLTQVSSQSTEIAEANEFISYLATRMPPPRPSSDVRPSPTPFVTGTLFINDGKCCIAAIAGQAVVIPVVFQAVSPAAEITEMRVRAGLTSFNESDLSDTEWVPFSPRRVFEYVPPLNWSEFYVTVQYRDALGNKSAVYSASISAEGMPPVTTTLTP